VPVKWLSRRSSHNDTDREEAAMTTTDHTPDLTLYRVVHRGMKGDAARLARAAALVAPGDIRRARAVTRWYEGFLGELHAHHTIEDTIFFPALVEKVPTFADQVPRIDREHALLSELLDATSAALRDLAEQRLPWGTASTRAADTTRELSALLDVHLGFEDDEVLPLFTEHFTADEYDELDHAATADPDLKQALFTVPWACDWATDDERDHAFETTPLVFRLIWRVRRRSYARLTQRVFGPIAKDLDALAAQGVA
jgi:hypothetical protein